MNRVNKFQYKQIWGNSLMVKVDLPVNEVKLEFDMEGIFFILLRYFRKYIDWTKDKCKQMKFDPITVYCPKYFRQFICIFHFIYYPLPQLGG